MLAETSRRLLETGVYVPSRPPGYPLTELALTPLIALGPLATNGVTALVSVLCVLLLRDLLRQSGAPGATELALALAAVPVVWIASVTTIDYLWGLALTLAGLRSAVGGHAVRAGVWIGLAAGARAPSALALLPALLLVRRRGACLLAALLVMAAAYVPLVLGLGLDALRPTGGTQPGARFVLRQSTLDVFGELGTAAVALALTFGLSRRVASAPLPRAGALLAALNLILYLLFPFEPGYLIPAVAGLLLWLGSRLPRPGAALLAVGLTLSSLVGITRRAPLPRDRALRIDEQELLDGVVRGVQAQETPTALLCGQLYPKVRYVLDGRDQVGPVSLHVAIKNETRLRQLLDQGIELRYVPGIEAWYTRRTGHRLDLIARPLP